MNLNLASEAGGVREKCHTAKRGALGHIAKDDALAVRSGPWKLIESQASAGGTQHQLHDLDNDPGETRNLAAEKPDVVNHLAAALAQIRHDGRSRP